MLCTSPLQVLGRLRKVLSCVDFKLGGATLSDDMDPDEIATIVTTALLWRLGHGSMHAMLMPLSAHEVREVLQADTAGMYVAC